MVFNKPQLLLLSLLMPTALRLISYVAHGVKNVGEHCPTACYSTITRFPQSHKSEIPVLFKYKI